MPPFDKQLKLNMVTEGDQSGWSLDEKQLASVVERMQKAEPSTTDIFYIREGRGNLSLDRLNKEMGAWATSRRRFGAMALYHLQRRTSQAETNDRRGQIAVFDNFAAARP